MNPLGECCLLDATGKSACGGDLCLSGGQVVCERCGSPQEGHPVMQEIEAYRQQQQATPPPAVVLNELDFARSSPLEVRVDRLERLVKEQGQHIQALKKQFGKLARQEAVA